MNRKPPMISTARTIRKTATAPAEFIPTPSVLVGTYPATASSNRASGGRPLCGDPLAHQRTADSGAQLLRRPVRHQPGDAGQHGVLAGSGLPQGRVGPVRVEDLPQGGIGVPDLVVEVPDVPRRPLRDDPPRVQPGDEQPDPLTVQLDEEVLLAVEPGAEAADAPPRRRSVPGRLCTLQNSAHEAPPLHC